MMSSPKDEYGLRPEIFTSSTKKRIDTNGAGNPDPVFGETVMYSEVTNG